ncbi:MAG: hypothetical protein GY913_14795 [Proteobacteria bacterium]|nr:hypothetical protein [Pseudomonadota bacterium]
MHAAWTAWHDGDDDRVAEAVRLLAETPGEGELTPLTETPGVSLVNALEGCDLATVEDLVIALEQDELFDIFDHYDRTYTTSLEEWESEAVPLTWTSDYGFSIPLTGTADATLLGEIRRLDDDVLAAVNVLAEPAVWEEEGNVFDEDFRLEAWVLVDGTPIHVEGLWRHMDAGAYNTENESIRNLVRNGIVDWDDQMMASCETGPP